MAAAEQEQQEVLTRLDEIRARLQSKRRILELAESRSKEQFWCLERELEEAGEPNLYQETREATALERELFGGLLASGGTGGEVAGSSSNGELVPTCFRFPGILSTSLGIADPYGLG